jgi:hypothetical protein
MIAEFQKNAMEKSRVNLRDCKGRQLVDIGIYYQDDAGYWLPPKRALP